MRVCVDASRCAGCGVCVEMCPEVFEMNGDGVAVARGPVTTENESSCRDAADACPTEAIEITAPATA